MVHMGVLRKRGLTHALAADEKKRHAIFAVLFFLWNVEPCNICTISVFQGGRENGDVSSVLSIDIFIGNPQCIKSLETEVTCYV